MSHGITLGNANNGSRYTMQINPSVTERSETDCRDSSVCTPAKIIAAGTLSQDKNGKVTLDRTDVDAFGHDGTRLDVQRFADHPMFGQDAFCWKSHAAAEFRINDRDCIPATAIVDEIKITSKAADGGVLCVTTDQKGCTVVAE